MLYLVKSSTDPNTLSWGMPLTTTDWASGITAGWHDGVSDRDICDSGVVSNVSTTQLDSRKANGNAASTHAICMYKHERYIIPNSDNQNSLNIFCAASVNCILFVLLAVTISYPDYTSIHFANAVTDAVLWSVWSDITSDDITARWRKDWFGCWLQWSTTTLLIYINTIYGFWRWQTCITAWDCSITSPHFQSLRLPMLFCTASNISERVPPTADG